MDDVKIGVVSTYPELSGLIQKLAREMGLDLEIREGILEKGVTYAYQFERQGADIVISRGVTGRKIKKAISLPVVLIEITSFDILQALNTAKSMGRRIAFLGHRTQDFSPEFDTITGILGIDVECYPYGNIYEMEEQAGKMLGSNADVIVSTGLCIYEMAKKSGINAVLVQSGYDAIYGSIKQALEMVQGVRRDQERSQRFKSVLELTNDGILILDERKRVSFMNPSAEKLLDADAGRILGHCVDELRESSFLGPLFSNGNQMNEVVKEVGKKQFLVNSMPINIKNKEKGLVINFQSADRIQILEQNIRRQLFKKGLVAKHTFDDFVGASRQLVETIGRAKKFAAATATVLIYGETGTGKELFAQSIHNESERCKGPFVAVNCAALPENLLESELFGYEEGAFTGAKKGGKSGLFEMAHGGTIFLDEIGEMTLPVQARLLRILQEREIMRLGSDRVIPVDVRIIAATNFDLIQALKQGKFRDDLYHRLEVLNLDIPPLRERKEDIVLLANYFINQFSVEERKEVPGLTKAALEKLIKYDWPGNIRELQNIFQKYVLLIEKNQTPEDLINRLINEKIRKSFSVTTSDENTITLKIGKLEDMEREIIDYLLTTGVSIKEISKMLGTSRTTLWRKVKDNDETAMFR
ncbi:zinc sigma-54-dependent two-component system response regulator [Desulfocucumis palustris]|uniref:Zinc sigma-54-dependent two-component system response regulator n=1 Tax=Desulfocucumis palustris TaxID=1898651 RepID=A0A2L2XFX8_9FIRM|nr:sigma 54-interacting transcriptional regulator [Desulfocucumis palustris]GBF35032.1 zinc sigma-54-dependent two-component system response regulator [Desulfocucumis palustris]